MEFIANGPDIPAGVLQAQDEGRLVLFCGAGISMPALPDFPRLVQRVLEELPTPAAADVIADKHYDRALGLIEEQFSPELMRSAVARILQVPSAPNLTSHQSILDIARDRDGCLRLVTTNFDLFFEAADPKLPKTAAPLLPVPKLHKWNSLVYLHGRLSDDDPECKHLVLTSGDFGTAYLVERWASRFVTELFNHATVVFVGYGINDPVMRYLVDAIAAERREDNRIHEAYAMAGFKAGELDSTRAEWEAKSIKPILFESTDSYSALRKTLVAWAGAWKGGLGWKRDIVLNTGPLKPAVLRKDEIDLFCWALKHKSGSMVRELEKLGSAVSPKWLPIFEREGLLACPPDRNNPVHTPLVDDGRSADQPPALDDIRSGMGHWMSTLLAEPELAQWVAAKGGHLHPAFSSLIRWRLGNNTNLSPTLRKVWTALTGSVPLQRAESAYHRFGFHQRVSSEAWSETLRVELLQALSPCISIHRSLGVTPFGDSEGGELPKNDELSIRSILSFDCEIEAGADRTMLLEDLRGRDDWDEIISDIAFDLASLLRKAMDLQAMLDGASAEADNSYIQQPSIDPHQQNHGFQGWTTLIELNREAGERLAAACDPRRARALLAVWKDAPYPVFRRLVLNATKRDGILEPEEVISILRADPSNWLWPVYIQVELFASLSHLWATLGGDSRVELLTLIETGPPREMYLPDLEEGEWEETRDHAIWRALARLERAGPPIEGAPAQSLRSLEAAHPHWRLSGDANEDFPYWSESRWGHESDFSAEELLALEPSELVRLLIEHKDRREGLIDAWGTSAKSDRARTLDILNQLATKKYFDAPVWSAGLSAFRELEGDDQLRTNLVPLLTHFPGELAQNREVALARVYVIRALSEEVSESLRAEVCHLWELVFPGSLAVAPMDSEEVIIAAINHPLGVLTEALLNILRSRELEHNGGIPEDLRGLFSSIIQAPQPAGLMGRALLASRLSLLHFVDSTWTMDFLIPSFSWTNSVEAIGAWQGYLWSPVLNPSLWVALKQHFLDTFDHIDEIGDEVKNLAALLSVVSIEAEEPPSLSEQRECLRKIGEKGRTWVANWIRNRLDGDKQQSAVLWRGSIGPWIAEAWPKEPSLRSKSASADLAASALLTGDEFPNAVEVVAPILGPIEHGTMILEKVRDSGLAEAHPWPCLKLINSVTPDEPPSWFGDLGEFLGDIERAEAGVAASPEYLRLQEIMLERGL